MIIDNQDALRSWLTSYLEPLCEADPQALAKYVMALIKKDKPEDDLRHICKDQLEVFLQKNTTPFVNVLFEKLSSKSYFNEKILPPVTSLAGIGSTAATTLTTNAVTVTSVSVPRHDEAADENRPPTVKLEPMNVATTGSGPTFMPMSQQSNPLMQEVSSLSTIQGQSKKIFHSSQGSNRERDREKARSKTKSRSRSRSRSPRYRASKDVDMRRGAASGGPTSRGYFNEDRMRTRARTGGPQQPRGMSRRHPGFRRGNYVGPIDRRRSPRSRSRTRSRSYSSSRSTRSRSRSRSRTPRSRSRSRSREKDGFNATKKPKLRSKSPTGKDGEHSSHGKKRCRDYDIRGFCMKGDLCQFDHGKDPVILDGNNASSVVLNLTTNSGTALLPTPQPPPQAALPFVPPANSFMPEPYNPEAPAIDHNSRRPPGPLLPHRGPIGPPQRPFWQMPLRGPPSGPGIHMNGPNPYLAPQNRPRELVGVPTVEEEGGPQLKSTITAVGNRTVIDSGVVTHMNFNSHLGPRGMRRGGGRGRGYRGRGHNMRHVPPIGHYDSMDKCVLEVRRIPSDQNTIANLNDHFSKFGTIVNLQVNYQGDGEAALIQFASHSEAVSAIKSTQAVLNNRFIRVFWQNKEQQQIDGSKEMEKTELPTSEQSGDGQRGTEVTFNVDSLNKIELNKPSRLSVKDRLGAKLTLASSSELDDKEMPTLTRTCYNPTLLKKSNVLNSSNSNGNAVGVKIQKTKDEQKKEKMLKKVEFQKMKRNLLESYVSNQKQLLEKLMKSKNEKEKTLIRTTIGSLDENIKALKADMEKDTQQILSETVQRSTKDMQKELLDAEIDLFKVENKGDTDLELRKKYDGLKAKEMGIKFSHLSRAKQKAERTKRTLDRRTTKILVYEIEESEQIDLQAHLAQYAEVQSIEHSYLGAVVTFVTRRDAEKAVSQIGTIKFKKHFTLKFTWLEEDKYKQLMKQNKTSTDDPLKSVDGKAKDMDDLMSLDHDVELLLTEDLEEEEETDDESRAWRR